ncbi:28S ribosomal protein L42, mitochondrial-like [Oppia nitens]|uniref:28S ribosomal protein L42, mitochondrial-like n=1 Tax=Oppia nitens TaxID=1686743 RepID=UPI0023DA9476|nr:28S ribosomal protein L42, mitochondrial-like [Oppia nitens]
MLNKLVLLSSRLRPRHGWLYINRLMSNITADNEAKITVTNDGQTIVCLHEDRLFPYEHSRPIPETSEWLKEDESVLKISHRISGQNIHHGSGPDLEELQLLTFTPAFKWKRRPLKRVVPKPPHPRPGI